MPFSFNVSFFDERSIRHPDVDQFIDGITEQLQQVILVYEMTSLRERKFDSSFYCSFDGFFSKDIRSSHED